MTDITLNAPKLEQINDSLQQAWAVMYAICYSTIENPELATPLAEVAQDLIKKAERQLNPRHS